MKRLLGLALLALAPSLAMADEGRVGGMPLDDFEHPKQDYSSKQRFSIELKFTPYTPHIDQSKGLAKAMAATATTPATRAATPFADLFDAQFDNKGNPLAPGKQPGYRLLTTVEFDWQFLRRAFGNFGIGLTTGFYRRTTHSFEYKLDANGNPVVDTTPGHVGQLVACVPDQTPGVINTCTRSGDETGLNIIPLSALFIYRFDLLANHYHFPLIPYVKVGLGYYIWWINDGNGILSAATYPRPTAEDPKPKGQLGAYGGSFGFVLNPGIALQLDFIDRAASKTMDQELGINHTYLFCELSYANINGFGARNKLDLSDTMLNAGIGFEF